MKKGTRVYWHKFIQNHPELLDDLRHILHKHGFSLVLTLDADGVCSDAFIVKHK